MTDNVWWKKILEFKLSDVFNKKTKKVVPIRKNVENTKKGLKISNDKKGLKISNKKSLKLSNYKEKLYMEKEPLIKDNTKKMRLSYADKMLKKNLKTKLNEKYINIENIINNYSSKPDIIKDEFIKSKLDIKWGVGLEHEMQIFHKSDEYKNYMNNKSSIDYGDILFDAQESTCYLTNHEDICCFKRETCSTKSKNKVLSADELKWIKTIPWELTGRQSKACSKGPWILERVPVLMPELVTGNHKNRTLASIVDELSDMQTHFLKLQMKNPYTRQKIKKYGKLITHPCGTLDTIKIPDHPTTDSDEYKFTNKPMKDYLGSYHITMTLPHHPNISVKKFVKLHQDFAQSLQWLEPLLLTSYFTGDPESVGSMNKKIKGSFRIMATGWGNLGGSDVRKFGTEGVSRGANIEVNWRDKVKFANSKILDTCAREVAPVYPKAKSIHAGDFRTFSFDFSGKCEGKDCPKVDGGKMAPSNGVEIRIFDHFDISYLYSLFHIMILVAENAKRHNPTDYVYKNKHWINALDMIMTHGWNALLDNQFINLLRKNLGLEINTKDNIAYNIFEELVSELFEVNKHGFIPSMMLDPKYIDKKPKIPKVNQMCWAISMDQKVGPKIYKHIKKYSGKNISYGQFRNNFLSEFNKKQWDKDIDDVLYSLEILNKLDLTTKKGKIVSIKFK